MTESTKASKAASATRDAGWTAAAIVDAGGIASTRAKTDPSTTGPLVALSFEHLAVAERTVVRLVEESLVDATDAEMRTLGFVRVGDAPEVGRARKRAIGFPAWALVHHPKKASFALDVMREFRKAAMRARTKPGHARDAFVEIGKRLERSVPAFMPSFWEEVARVFLAEDATGIAGQCFERARTAERAYKLPVDEDVRAAAYLEFTTAGAVPAKSLVGYAADLTKAFGAKEAAARFSRLNVQRIKAGLPPWNGMAKELRKLAAAAKDPSIEESFLREVVTASGLKKAPLDFWTTYREPLVALAKESSEVRASLSRLWPAARGARSKLVSAWLGVLDDVGVIDSIAQGPATEIAAFLGALTRYATERDYGDDAPLDGRYFEILTRLAPPLVAAKQPVDLRSWGWNDDGNYAPDVLETALELGLVLEAPKPEATLEYDEPFSKNHALLAAHPDFAPLVVRGVASAFGREPFETCAKGKPALVEARRQCLLEKIAGIARGGLPRLSEELESLEDVLRAEHLAEMPEAVTALAAVDVAPSLAWSLRAGVFDELAWPEYEEVLASFGPKAEIETYGSRVHPILRAGRKVVVFDGPKVLRSYDLPTAVKELENLLFVDGDLLVAFEDKEAKLHGLWMSKPKQVFALENSYVRGVIEATPIPGGGVTLGHGPALHAGDTPKKIETDEHVSDGTRFWAGRGNRWDKFVLRELDPKTGKTTLPSWPAFLREVSEKDDGLRLTEVFVAPLPQAKGSLLGWADGLVGHYRRHRDDGPRRGELDHELVRIDGKRWSAHDVELLIDWPGDEAPRGLECSSAWSRSESDSIALHVEGDERPSGTFGDGGWEASVFRLLPRVEWLHYVRPRDLASSRALRAVDEAKARELLEVARVDDPEDDDAIDAAIEAVTKLLPKVKDEHVRRAAARVVKIAAQKAAALERLQDRGAGGGGVDDATLRQAIPSLPTAGWSDGSCTVDIARVVTAFREGTTPKLSQSAVAWERVADRLAKLACFVASRTNDEGTRASLRKFTDELCASGIFGLTVTFAELEVKTKSSLLERPKDREVWIASVGDARWFVRMEDFDEDEPKQKVVVLVPGAKLVVPKDATITSQRTYTVGDDTAFVEAFWRELDARGVASHDPAAVARVTEQTTLNAAEATLVLRGFPRFDTWEHDFLGKELRTELGLKVGDAARAKERLRDLEEDERFELVASVAAVPVASGYWAPADSPEGVAQALVAVARRLFGKSVVLREDLLVSLEKANDLGLDARKALTMLVTASDDDNPWLKAPKVASGKNLECDEKAFGEEVVQATAWLVASLSAQLPVGDEVRALLPVLYDRVRANLEHPELLLELGTMWEDSAKKRAAFLDRIGGKSIEIRDGKEKYAGRDTGTIVARDEEYEVTLSVRSARLRKNGDEVLPFLRVVEDDDDDEGGAYASDVAKRAYFLMSEECEALVARVRKTPVAAGAYELDPSASVPKLVAEAREALGVSDDAAALYLQMLALPSPTKKLVTQVTGWTSARYEKAATELSKKKWVIEGKRERSGRAVFLPGTWDKLQGVAMEGYKLALFQSVAFDEPMLTVAPHEAYARAWARWKSGDRPGFEDVEKKPKKAATKTKKGK
jgi:hypothetical protein